ncbi:unnamed protein product [Macrosiphum euphorbiae]|uniref:PiggyBac transposable element-derived protein domain-containing protein n=1 Tax=Macrosiphum euphorbiae TaxID=13131 RepID=A0AAV0WL45_9HEMI|nr:unnamed protein product [Macrosiphum euphorbiae]
MGGVDKLDQLISYYRIFIRSRKWTLRMIMHAFDMAISNCWIQYKKEADILKVPKKKIMDLLDFRMELAENLILVGKPITPKRRVRPSREQREQLPIPGPPLKKNKVDAVQPTREL